MLQVLRKSSRMFHRFSPKLKDNPRIFVGLSLENKIPTWFCLKFHVGF